MLTADYDKKHPLSQMSCKKLLKSANKYDQTGYQNWQEKFTMKQKYGKFVCQEGVWQKVWDYPICPDRMVQYEWYNFAVVLGLVDLSKEIDRNEHD